MKYIKSPLNYTGNKYKLLNQIIPMFPNNIDTFVDVFGGSGTVLINTAAKKYFYNEYAKYVFDIFNGLITTDYEMIITKVNDIISYYELSKTNECGYRRLRDDYNNNGGEWIVLYVLCCYAFNSQGRFNTEGKFNMPFGKNRSCFSDVQRENIYKLKVWAKDKFFQTSNLDFRNIEYENLKQNDFVYFDPPYLGSVATYNEKNGWTQEQENELEKILNLLNEKGIRFALPNNLKYNNKTLIKLCEKYNTYHLGSKYTNSSYNKTDKVSQDDEVLVTNYNIKENNIQTSLF